MYSEGQLQMLLAMVLPKFGLLAWEQVCKPHLQYITASKLPGWLQNRTTHGRLQHSPHSRNGLTLCIVQLHFHTHLLYLRSPLIREELSLLHTTLHGDYPSSTSRLYKSFSKAGFEPQTCILTNNGRIIRVCWWAPHFIDLPLISPSAAVRQLCTMEPGWFLRLRIRFTWFLRMVYYLWYYW